MSVLTPDEFANELGLLPTPAPSGLPDQPGLYISYRTQTGDRWDTVAFKFFGDPTQIGALIMANPGIAILDVFDAGTDIAIPLIATPSGGVTSSPPWAS